jgi:hypothetical protein
LLMLPILGFWQFSAEEDDAVIEDDLEDANAASESASVSSGKRAALYSAIPSGLQFKLRYKNSNATLTVVEGGVMVAQGSLVADPVTDRFEIDAGSYAALRRQLTESGVIAPTPAGLAFTKDQYFSSGSAAAAVVRGSFSNADWWKGSSGKNLGDYIREAKTKS